MTRIADALAIDAHLVVTTALAVIAAVHQPSAMVERVALPGTEVELPSDGRVRQGLQERPAIEGPALARKHYVGGLEVVVTLSLVREELALDLQWTCGERWTDVRMIARRDSRVALERLGETVTQTIRCR